MENQTSVVDIIRRQSVGGFSDRPVPRSEIEEIMDVARRAPSGVNTQPWNVFVVQGQARARMLALAVAVLPGLVREARGLARFRAQLAVHSGIADWPAQGEHAAGDAFLAQALAVSHADPPPAEADLMRYFRFFDAPVGLLFTISNKLGLGSELDYGMFLQNLTLAARARGLHTCVQTGWKGLADLVLPELGADDDMLLLCGMALGYPDATQPSVAVPGGAPRLATFTTWHS